jgi:PAS domain S-box-containing protein
MDIKPAPLSEAEFNSINRRLFETSLDLILVTNRQGNFIQVSPSSRAILGYRPDELIGLSGRDFIHADDLEPTRQEMRAARQGKLTRHFDSRYLHKDGRVVPLSWTGVWSEQDQHHFFIGRDMTERQGIEAQLRQAQKMEAVGQLTGGLAHDFNNILMVILANLETIEEEHALPDEVKSLLEGVEGAARRAAELTRHLLAFSRKQPLRPRATDLNGLVSGLGKLLRRALGEQVRIDERLADGLWVTNIDQAQLEAALVNLCVNARDAMPDGGRLLIETDNVVLDEEYASRNTDVTAGPYAMLAVTDTGKGIARDILDRVFEPFFTTKGVGKGTGLGLSMVYGFIKQSKGHIKIYSELGRGTSIKIYLPRSAEEQDSAPQAAAEPLPLGTEHILLVEDDSPVRASVLRQLRSLGYTVTEADCGDAALALMQAGRFDAIVSDMVMPGRHTGLMVLEEAARRWPKMGTILMSGYTENAMIQEGRLPDHVRLLTKPFTKAGLARVLRRAIAPGGSG